MSGQWENIKKNYFTFIFSGIIALIVGYFSGIGVVNKDIDKIHQRLSVLETYIKDVAKVKIPIIEKNRTEDIKLAQDIEYLKEQNALAIQTNNIIELRIEQIRADTIKELRELIK